MNSPEARPTPAPTMPGPTMRQIDARRLGQVADLGRGDVRARRSGGSSPVLVKRSLTARACGRPAKTLGLLSHRLCQWERSPARSRRNEPPGGAAAGAPGRRGVSGRAAAAACAGRAGRRQRAAPASGADGGSGRVGGGACTLLGTRVGGERSVRARRDARCGEDGDVRDADGRDGTRARTDGGRWACGGGASANDHDRAIVRRPRGRDSTGTRTSAMARTPRRGGP